MQRLLLILTSPACTSRQLNFRRPEVCIAFLVIWLVGSGGRWRDLVCMQAWQPHDSACAGILCAASRTVELNICFSASDFGLIFFLK